jgi:hypothetical protein
MTEINLTDTQISFIKFLIKKDVLHILPNLPKTSEKSAQEIAVMTDPSAIFNIEAPSEDLIILAVKSGLDPYDVYGYTQDIADAVFEKEPKYLSYIPERFHTKEMAEKIAELGYSLTDLREDLITDELVEKGISNGGFGFWLHSNPSYDLVLKDLTAHPGGYFYLSREHKTEEIMAIAVKSDMEALNHCLEITPKIAEIAIENHPSAIKYIPRELQTIELCVKAVKRRAKNTQFILNPEYFELSIFN